MYQFASAAEQTDDHASRASVLLARISGLRQLDAADDSPQGCVVALAEHERQLQELSALLTELGDVGRELDRAAPESEAAVTREALREVLAPVERAARRALALSGEVSARRRELAALLNQPVN